MTMLDLFALLGIIIFKVGTVYLQCSYPIQDQVVYEGCFLDDEHRLFPYIYGETSFPVMTNDFCILACTDEGFKYAATEATDWCRCGNDPYIDPVTYSKVTESDCSLQCKGDSSQKCGGHWRSSIYNTGTLFPNRRGCVLNSNPRNVSFERTVDNFNVYAYLAKFRCKSFKCFKRVND